MELEATLDAELGDAVEFVLHVVNSGSYPVELTFPTGQIGDVAVYHDEPEDPVWQWSEDRAFTQAIEERTLAPGETIEQVFTWTDPAPGEYEAVARLKADTPVTASTSIRVG